MESLSSSAAAMETRDGFTLLLWNILHGGGPARTPEVLLAILRHRPDIVVLTEYRAHRGGQLAAALAGHGLSHQAVSGVVANENGVFIACRWAVEPDPPPLLPPLAAKWAAVRIPALRVRLGAVHVPDDSAPTARRVLWQTAAGFAAETGGGRAILAGDFNTGRRREDAEKGGFSCEAMLGKLASRGFVDCWRMKHPGAREYSWLPRGGEGTRSGRRIDHVFASAALAKTLQTSEFSQVEREAGFSDHAALMVRFSGEGVETAPPGSASPCGVKGLFSAVLKNAPESKGTDFSW